MIIDPKLTPHALKVCPAGLPCSDGGMYVRPLQHRKGCTVWLPVTLATTKMADRIIQSADLTRCRKRATDVDFEVCLDHFSHMIATWSKYTVGHQELSVIPRPSGGLE